MLLRNLCTDGPRLSLPGVFDGLRAFVREEFDVLEVDLLD